MGKRALAIFLLNGLFCAVLAGQTPANQPSPTNPPVPTTQQRPAYDETPTIRTTTREVILDVIVRDKHHHALADLRPDEIEVYEDGVKQKINAFRDVQGVEELHEEQALAMANSGSPASPPNTSANTPAKTPSTALRELNFVSIVLAQIAPLNLEFAREAVQEFLKSDTLPNTYVTIYRLDRSLEVIQPYTADHALLANAVNAAAKGVHTGGDLGISATVASGINTSVQATGTNILANPLTGPATAQAVQDLMLNPVPAIVSDPMWARNAASQDASLALGNALVAQAQIASGLRVAESLSDGMDAMEALRELVRVQAKLPGRKVVLYLADGLTLPMGRRDVVDSVITYANQMEVAFYAVDTRGLSVDDPMAESLAALQRAGAESAVNKVSPRIGHQEDNDVLLSASSDRQLSMEELAESTGGFAVTNTNEIALPMQHVMEDIRTHYEVAYTPSATTFDGHFRRIQVRIARPHVTVQTRSGYFALPEINGEPLQSFEMTALHAINSKPVPVEFPYQTALLKFRPKAAGSDYEMAFDVPVSSLRVENGKGGKAQVRLSLVALIHNSSGDVIGKVSRNLVREAPKADLSHLGDDHILYAEPIELPRGHYWIDTAVTDELAEKTTVKRMSVFVDSAKDFGVSSLELVRRVQPLPERRDLFDPFETDSGRIVPTLADSVPSGKPVDVYFVVYPASTSEAEPTITLQLYHDGRKVGLRKLGSPRRQADGSIPMMLRINPDPGQCDMVITAHQGRMSSEATLSLRVTPGGTSDPN
jgi:VWFA-related protein